MRTIIRFVFLPRNTGQNHSSLHPFLFLSSAAGTKQNTCPKYDILKIKSCFCNDLYKVLEIRKMPKLNSYDFKVKDVCYMKTNTH